MNTLRQKTYLVALLMVVAAFFAGCKGESSPTAPTTSTNPGGGGVTPPTGASVTLTVSNANPFVSGTSVITATVTQSGQPVPNGTAVEFTTDFGTFTETGATSALRTTTNGVATVTLTSSTAGKSTIQAVVNNVAKTTTVTFQLQQQPQCPPNCPPVVAAITSISPTFGNPGGGETVTITGTNFQAPVRVFFDFGTGTTPKEAFVVSQTSTSIVVVTPPTDLGTGQTKNATIVVFNQAGTTSEARLTAPTPFVFQAEVLTPSITTLSPSSGPIDGGTRVTIFGDAFQAPVQVFFGSAEAQVVSVQFKQLIVMSPTARDTAPGGSGAVTGAVDIKVININSSKTATLTQGFRYTPKMQITAFGPGTGTAFGGTRVTIDGIGFNDPVTVSIGGIVATPIKVTGTQVVAVTGRTPAPCTPPSGPVIITNVDNGDQATSAPTAFAYIPEVPLITSVVTPTCNNPGCNVQVTVFKPGVGTDGTAIIRFTFGTGAALRTVFPTPTTITDPVGPTTFQMPIPTPDFPTVACTIGGLGGTRQTEAKVELRFTNVTTGCTDAIQNFVIAPTNTTCTLNAPAPAATVSPTTMCPATPAPPGFGTHPTGSTTNQILTVSNTGPSGASDLIVTNALITGPNADQFTVTPTSATIAQGTGVPFTVSFKPTASGTKDATLTLFTNDPARQQITVCLQGIAP